METYLFAALDEYSSADLNNIEQYLLDTENFYEVVLSSEEQLRVLFDLLQIDSFEKKALNGNKFFYQAMDFSTSLLPELNQEAFDGLYERWLKVTGRESSMDEYGQLIFLLGQFEKFNSKKCRLVLLVKP